MKETISSILRFLYVCLLVYLSGKLSYLVGQSDVRAAVNRPVPAVRMMQVTAYCPCSKCCGKWADGITASGHVIQPGDKFCAADHSIPFGTKINIPGYGFVEVKDRGGSVYGNRLDVFFSTHEKALQWGVQDVGVIIQKGVGSK